MLSANDESAIAVETLREKLGPEIVIALVGPVGTDLNLIGTMLQRLLRPIRYDSSVVLVSELLSNVKRYQSYATKKFDSAGERIEALMKAGSDIRRETKHANALALLSVSEIQGQRYFRNQRILDVDDPNIFSTTPLERHAFIIKSLKNPAEIRTLKDVYGRAFFVISAYSPKKSRVEGLARQIARSVNDSDESKYSGQAGDLVAIDENEGDKFGQNVRDSFPMADIFVDTTDAERMEQELERFISILFGNSFRTPTRDEYAMFHAHSAALRSADPSRQVGATVANEEGQILAVGCNDAPKFGGGLYWEEDKPDGRDFKSGSDVSTTARIDTLSETLARLNRAGLLEEKHTQEDTIRALAEDLLAGEQREVMKGSQIASIIEYGRSVHAEMAALCDAAQRGISVQDGTLFCTTFPCHLCARHIIASGIKRVVYIEPYPKSNAAKLYKDSMVVDPDSECDDRVIFESFVGIAPSVYSFMFKMNDDNRKNSDGSIDRWEPSENCNPRLRRFVWSYIAIEDLILKEIPNVFTGDFEIVDPS